MAKRTLSRDVQSLGGKALLDKQPPLNCPKCNKPIMFGTNWHQYLGHLSLHRLAEKYFGGDLAALQRRLQQNGLARQDPTPWNGAWPKYKSIKEQ